MPNVIVVKLYDFLEYHVDGKTLNKFCLITPSNNLTMSSKILQNITTLDTMLTIMETRAEITCFDFNVNVKIPSFKRTLENYMIFKKSGSARDRTVDLLRMKQT